MFCPACRADYPEGWNVCPKDATPLLRSPQIGKYTIDGTIGVGGMGAVYRATNPDTQSGVAVKVMHPHVAGAAEARKRFQREAAAVARLNTVHVVKVNDFGTEADGTMYLVMELLAGHALRDEIRPPPALPELARVQFVLDGSLKGLAAAHKAGIVHRDLKPENIFVASTDDGEVPKLLDFGIARIEAPGTELTRTGMMMGTASYMAPEQVAGKTSEIGPWSDTYAMGVIMYELLSGQLAFGGSSLTEVLAKVLQGTVTPLREVRSGLPDKLYELVDRCLSLDPKQRPRDADELRAALAEVRLVPAGSAVPAFAAARPDAIAATIGVTPVPATVGADTPVPAVMPVAQVTPAAALDTVPPPPNRRALVAAIAGLAVVGVIVAIVAITSGHKATEPVAITSDAAIASVTDAAVVDGQPLDPIESADILARAPTSGEVMVKHVLISWKDTAPAFRGKQDPRGAARTQADAAKLATETAGMLRAAPDQIDALVKATGEDPGATSGDPYTVAADTPFVPEFKRLSLRLQLREVGIVKTAFGYHVVERVPPPAPDPFESTEILARAAVTTAARVQHILIGWKDLATSKNEPRAQKRTKADADKEAKQILDTVAGGADMVALMKELSEDPGSKDNGKAYEIDAGNKNVPAPFKNLALRLHIDEAGMVRTPLGWHIMKRIAPLPPDRLNSTDILAREPVTKDAKVKHILLGWKGIDSARDPRAKRDRAELEKLVKQTLSKLAHGASFEELMASLSEDPGSAKTGKDYDVTPDGAMVQSFKDLSLRLNVGEVGVVKSDFGIHIIKRVE